MIEEVNRFKSITQQVIALSTSLTIDEIKNLALDYNKLLKIKESQAFQLDKNITYFLDIYSESISDNFLDALEEILLEMKKTQVSPDVINNIKKLTKKIMNSSIDKEKYFYDELGQEAELLLNNHPSFQKLRIEKGEENLRLNAMDAEQSIKTKILDDFIGDSIEKINNNKKQTQTLSASYSDRAAEICNDFLEKIANLSDSMENIHDSILSCDIASKLIQQNQSVEAILNLKFKDIYKYIVDNSKNKIVKLINLEVCEDG